MSDVAASPSGDRSTLDAAIRVVQTLGFPVAVAAVLLWLVVVELRDARTERVELLGAIKGAIDTQTAAMRELALEVRALPTPRRAVALERRPLEELTP